MNQRAARKTRYFIDLDSRLMGLWSIIWEDNSISRPDTKGNKILTEAMRAAYDRGYKDALIEDTEGNRAKLYTDNDFPLPEGIK